jgi:acetylornithine deacetylase/succinyl-diaminopimelate desuccinylase-like protein
MDFSRLKSFVDAEWTARVMDPLLEYMAIPCESPAFDPAWAEHGHIDRAAALLADWARAQLSSVPGATVEVIRLESRTPIVFVEIPGDSGDPVLIYGHLDKQPPMEPWAHGRSAWVPSLEGDRLYGRGGADDGYSIFSAVLSVLALREQGASHPRCLILIEGCEESGSEDLPFYIDHLLDRLGRPGLVVALDSGCGDYDQLWVTTSLRGQVAGVLSVRVLTQGVHSGEASGIVPSSFRIATRLIARLEDPDTGEIVAPGFAVVIPEQRRLEAAAAAVALGSKIHGVLPFVEGARPVSPSGAQLALNRSWRPQLAVTGIDGLPAVDEAASVMEPFTALKLSLRVPPTSDPIETGRALKNLLESDPPYGAAVSFDIDFVSPGWHAPATEPWLSESLQRASQQTFGRSSALFGGGGGIPFLTMLGEKFPQTQFVVTGVLGPQSNAHGPNEFLHLPTALKVTAALSQVLHDAAAGSRIRKARPAP